MSISVEYSPPLWIGRFFQLSPKSFCHCPSSNQEGIYVYLNTGSGFDSGQQWQNDLGDSWKNRPIHKGGEYSTLIDMKGDGLPERSVVTLETT
jgi:hypothetical protein